MERENAGLVQRWWTCPSCLHRETTIENEEEPMDETKNSDGVDGLDADGRGEDDSE